MEDLTGKQFGPYQIVAPLGEGGMAAVYKAYQPSMERYVAVKVLPRQMANSTEFIARFKREARMLAQLQHPHILAVFDYGESDGYTYIVMPYLQSGTLADLLRTRRMSMPEIRRIITQVGDALGYAHASGMIHRDVKPSNVLLDERDNCLLTDFGLARMTEASAKLTSSGAIMGTPAYMSPEQGAGTALDGRSDIYSLGIILYEMVTGQVPYFAETPIAIVFKHISDPLPSARKFVPELSDDLERVILKSLAKSPADRYQKAEDFVQAVQLAIPVEPTNRPTPAAAPRTVIAAPTESIPQPVSQPPAQASVPPSAPYQPVYRPVPQPVAEGPRQGIPTWLLLGVGFAAVCGIAIVALLFGMSYFKNNPLAALIASATPQTTDIPTPDATATITPTPEPSATATLPAPPTPAPPPGIKFVRIDGITLNAQKQYVVEYETFEYQEVLPGLHVHFYFDTVPPVEAGMPGHGPWKIYGGPRPFTGYRSSDRPKDAARMCALVANPNHSAQPDSGACFPLPDVPTATARLDIECLDRPDGQSVAAFRAGIASYLRGLSGDNLWALIQNPDRPQPPTCWVPVTHVVLGGDTSKVPVVSPP